MYYCMKRNNQYAFFFPNNHNRPVFKYILASINGSILYSEKVWNPFPKLNFPAEYIACVTYRYVPLQFFKH